LYPLGFPLVVETNSEDVVAAARESWASFRPASDRPAIRLRVAVSEGPAGDLPPDPNWRGQERLMVIVSDSCNFAVCNFAGASAFAWLTPAAAADRAWVRFHYLESMVYSTLSVLYLAPLHAACVARNGFGVLLGGESGAGKSTLAFACARAGWTFLTDDASFLERGGDSLTVIGKPYHIRFRESAAGLFPELAGLESRRRPNGRTGIEVLTAGLAGMATASRCRAGALVFLNRVPAGPASLAPVEPAVALERCLEGSPTYGNDVRAAHRDTLSRLASLGAFELTYSRLGDAVQILDGLAPRGGVC
jgi:hypothetical protein